MYMQKILIFFLLVIGNISCAENWQSDVELWAREVSCDWLLGPRLWGLPGEVRTDNVKEFLKKLCDQQNSYAKVVSGVSRESSFVPIKHSIKYTEQVGVQELSPVIYQESGREADEPVQGEGDSDEQESQLSSGLGASQVFFASPVNQNIVKILHDAANTAFVRNLGLGNVFQLQNRVPWYVDFSQVISDKDLLNVEFVKPDTLLPGMQVYFPVVHRLFHAGWCPAEVVALYVDKIGRTHVSVSFQAYRDWRAFQKIEYIDSSFLYILALKNKE